MTINQLAVLRTYLESISQYESPLSLSNRLGTGIVDKYKNLNRLSTVERQFDIDKLRSELQQRYYQDYYDVLSNSSIIYFLENGEKISKIVHLFAYSEIDFPLSFLEKSLAEVDQFGDWLHSQLTLETDCWVVTHEVYRQLNKLRIRIRNLIEAKGRAEAEAIRLKLDAEAEGLDKKAEAMKKYGQAAITEMLVNVLPEIAKNVATPLANVDSITMYGEGNSGKMVGDIMTTMNQVTQGMGLDVKELISATLTGRQIGQAIAESGKTIDVIEE